MIAGPPYLWLCGHIHEGRGAESVSFGVSPRETLVINAANANSGRATHIASGPIVVDIDENGNLNFVEGEGIIGVEQKNTEAGSKDAILA